MARDEASEQAERERFERRSAMMARDPSHESARSDDWRPAREADCNPITGVEQDDCELCEQDGD
jgi:hypothetical protein